MGAAGRRVGGYSRVSTQRQADEGYSIADQERAIVAYCRAHGWPEPVMYGDYGVSAFSDAVAKRPAFARLLADAEAGVLDTIIVARMDRWARNVGVTVATLQRLERAGVALISLAEQIDYSSAVGRLTVNMMASVAQYQSDDKSAVAKRVHADLRAQGKLSSGSPPWGAMRDGEGRATLDPALAPALARALELVATCSYHVACDRLNEEGIPPPGAARRYRRGQPRGWWPQSLRQAIRKSAYLLDQPEPWPARYLAAMHRPEQPPVARTRTIRALTGLLRCGSCGHAVVYSFSHATTDLRLRCETPGCKLTYGRADRHERAVLAAVARLRPRPRPATTTTVDARAWAEIAEQRRRYAAMFGGLRIDEATYEAALADLDAREAQLADAGTPARDLGGVALVLPHLDLLPPERQNGYLRDLLARVVVTGKDERRIVWRPDAAAAFTGTT